MEGTQGYGAASLLHGSRRTLAVPSPSMYAAPPRPRHAFTQHACTTAAPSPCPHPSMHAARRPKKSSQCAKDATRHIIPVSLLDDLLSEGRTRLACLPSPLSKTLTPGPLVPSSFSMPLTRCLPRVPHALLRAAILCRRREATARASAKAATMRRWLRTWPSPASGTTRGSRGAVASPW